MSEVYSGFPAQAYPSVESSRIAGVRDVALMCEKELIATKVAKKPVCLGTWDRWTDASMRISIVAT